MQSIYGTTEQNLKHKEFFKNEQFLEKRTFFKYRKKLRTRTFLLKINFLNKSKEEKQTKIKNRK